MSKPIPANGLLPRDKGTLLAHLHSELAAMPREQRDSHPSKDFEGSLQ